MRITRTIAETRAALSGGQVGLVPTMGAYHAGHLSLFAAAREENDVVVASLFVNPAQFGNPADLARYPRDESADAAIAEEAGRRPPLRAGGRGALPARLRDLGRRRARLAGPRRRPPARPFPGRRDHLPEALQHRPPAPRLLRPEGRAAGRGRPPDDPRPRTSTSSSACCRPSATPTASRSPPATRSSPPGEREAALALPARPRHARPGRGAPPARRPRRRLRRDRALRPTRPRRRRPRRLRPPDRQRPPRRRHRMSAVPAGKLPLPELLAMKERGDKIVMVTAYDAPGARFAEDAGIDMVLVGDTAAMVVLGYEGTTVPVTVDEMLFLTRTVARNVAAAARRRRHAVRLVSGVRRGRRPRRRSASSRRAAPTSSSSRAPARWSRACARSSRPASR